jgi:hypothetical protein
VPSYALLAAIAPDARSDGAARECSPQWLTQAPATTAANSAAQAETISSARTNGARGLAKSMLNVVSVLFRGIDDAGLYSSGSFTATIATGYGVEKSLGAL